MSRVSFPGVGTTVTPARPVDLPHTFFGLAAKATSDETGALRQFVLQGIRHGRPFQPLVTYNTWFVYGTRLDEDTMVAEIDRAASLGVELFVMDAGWYLGAGETSDFDFDAGLGSWTADPDRFPSGLASLADYAHGVGLKFGLWVEPERVSLATVGKPGLAQESWLATRGNDYGSALNAQICLAGAAGRKWVMDQLVALIDRVRPDYLKWDNNFWINCDRAGHGHGAADGNMAHVQALYGILDELRRRYPDLHDRERIWRRRPPRLRDDGLHRHGVDGRSHLAGVARAPQPRGADLRVSAGLPALVPDRRRWRADCRR